MNFYLLIAAGSKHTHAHPIMLYPGIIIVAALSVDTPRGQNAPNGTLLWAGIRPRRTARTATTVTALAERRRLGQEAVVTEDEANAEEAADTMTNHRLHIMSYTSRSFAMACHCLAGTALELPSPLRQPASACARRPPKLN